MASLSLSKTSFLLATLPIIMGALTLAGWILGIDLLQKAIPSSVAMNPATAMGLILLGLEGLRLRTRNHDALISRAGQLAILVVIIAAAMKLSDLVAGTSFAIDQQFFATQLNKDLMHPNRMAPNTASCFFLLGCAMQLMRSQTRAAISIAQVLTAIIALFALLAIVGYLYGVQSLYGVGAFIPMAFNTAIAFLLLAMTILFTHPNQGYMLVFTSGGPAERIASILLPATLLVPFLLGWISMTAQRAGLIDSAFDHALSVVIDVAIFFTLSYISVRTLFFSDLHRQKALAELHESASRINAILNTVADGIITISERGIVETFNPAAERLFGYAAAEVIGQNVSMLMPEPYRNQHDGYIERYISSGKAHIIGIGREVVGLRKNGSTFPMELTVSEMQLGENQFFTGIVHDITVRKQAEFSVRESEARLRRLLEISPIGVRILRLSDKRRIFSNKAYGDVFRTTQEELLTADPAIYYQNPQEYHEICRRLDKGEDIINYKIELRGGYGERVWAMASFVRIQFEGELADLAWFYDITPIHKAQEKAEQANQFKTDFLSTMSHEIRTPLTGMLGMLELLSLTPLNNEQNATLDAAWDSGRSLLRIVSDILDWSKIEEGKLQLTLQATSIPQLLQEVVNTYSHVASAKSLVLRQHADSRLSPAHIVDPLRLTQVLNNFVSNAIKFTRQGEIELRAELLGQFDSGDLIRFSVKDTGVGIAKNVQKHVFQRYRQESADTARLYGGTGLGLAICQRLAELMDGQIELESEPGRGSTFSIKLTLPVSGAPGEAVQSLHPEVNQRAVKPLFDDNVDAPLVLAVDDHPINRDLLASQIRLLGLRVETAEDGRVALSMWKGGRFALVITDCHMPEMDGYAFSQEIRKIESEEARPRVPIIAWTANALAGESERCQAAGMDDLLVKPANLRMTRKTLAKWLSIAETDISQPTPTLHSTNSGQSAVPINYEVLQQIVPESWTHLQMLLKFQAHIRADHAKLLQYFEQEDLANVERIAHRMKGSSLMVGAMDMGKSCATIEQTARDGDMAGARAAKMALDEAVRQFEVYLNEVVKPEEKG